MSNIAECPCVLSSHLDQNVRRLVQESPLLVRVAFVTLPGLDVALAPERRLVARGGLAPDIEAEYCGCQLVRVEVFDPGNAAQGSGGGPQGSNVEKTGQVM